METVEQAVPMGADPGEILEWRCEVFLSSLTELTRAASQALELAGELNDVTYRGDARIARIRGMFGYGARQLPRRRAVDPPPSDAPPLAVE